MEASGLAKKLHKKKEAKKALLKEKEERSSRPFEQLAAGGKKQATHRSSGGAASPAARVAAFAAETSASSSRALVDARSSPRLGATAVGEDAATSFGVGSKGGKKRGRKPPTGVEDGPYRTVVLTDVCADLRPVYARTLRTFLPALQKQLPTPVVMEEMDGCMVTLEVESKQIAEQIHRRLHNATVFGRRVKVEYHDADALKCSAAPVLVDVRLSAPTTCTAVSKLLSTVQGFLAVASTDGLRGGEEDALSRTMIATFADEGSALHARAVLSGRLLGSSATHMFLSRR